MIICLSTNINNLLKSGNYNNFIKIILVRDPYTKCISGWKYCNSLKTKSLIDALNNPPGGLNKCPIKYVNNLGNGTIFHDWAHFTLTQTQMLIQNNKKIYDKLFKYENYTDILDFINRKLGIGIKECKLNKTNYNKKQIKLTDNEKKKFK